MDIYEVLRTKPHSERHLTRYVKFIQSRTPQEGPLERHHICPKASDLFPQFKSFIDHPWNRIDLTSREHYIAHLLLWKVFGGSQSNAVARMCLKRSSRLYEQMKTNAISAFKTYAKTDIGKTALGKAKRAHTRRPLTEEHKAKLRKPKSNETKAKISAARFGMKFSEEHKIKIGNASRGRVLRKA
jgi:hypothetical protein